MNSQKVLPFTEALAQLQEKRLPGKKIVQCHGTFDLIHPGHIYHLEEAKDLGDILVVTITAERFVNKGPGRPYFNDQLRAKSLAALACVDYVVVVPFPAAVEAIECVRPDIYCKGTEYEVAENDVTGNIGDDLTTVERLGGQVRYIGSVVFSSSRMLNNHFDHIDPSIKDFCRTLAKEFPPDKFREAVDGFRDLKVLVLGDIIFDRYTYIKVQGLTSKNRMLSGRYLTRDDQPGGALAIYRHIAQFCNNAHLIGLVGTDDWTARQLAHSLPEASDLVLREEGVTTVIKERFVEPVSEGKEMSKLFSVNYLDDGILDEAVAVRLERSVASVIKDYDLVVVADFGHGIMHEKLRRLAEDKASFLAVNCQTNSNNHGFNIINHQYQRMDCFSLDNQELMLSVGRRHLDHARELDLLRRRFHASYAWLTRGVIETIGSREGYPLCTILPFESTVTDTIGAGDAFYSVAALAATCGLSNNLATFLGQLAGAQAVGIVGNSEPVSKQRLLKSGMTMLNF
ncbi:MAG: adenylyltransferase/cytidyltransferase family protein [Verrucomicrobiae bacterium]